uniref:Sarcoglycan alpha n=1 Tax=Cairina moschata TaxID=8855 RepID=A0A8C3CEE6_CAIMO
MRVHPMDMCVRGSGAGRPRATLAGGGGGVSCPQMSPHPHVPRRAVVTRCAPSCAVVSCCVPWCPLCPAMPSCVPLRPPVPPMPSCAPLCPTVPHYIPLCPIVPRCPLLCPAVSCHAPSCPVVSHCTPLCPVVPHLVPLCPTLSRCAPPCPAVPPLPSQPPQAVAPGRAHPEQRAQRGPTTHPSVSPLLPRGRRDSVARGRAGRRWPWQGPHRVPVPPVWAPPGPASPAAAVTQALAPLPVKMEAPELLRLWVLAALVLGGTRAALPDHHISLETGAVFVHELERELFQEAFLDEAEDDDDAAPITFHAHLLDHPDLPRWLRFAQRGAHQPGFLYGSPTAAEVGTHIVEVLAYNRLTYETVAQRLVLAVVPAPGGEPPFQSEFLVGNRNVEELLPAPARELFGQAAAGVWEQSDLSIINVTSALDRGGRVPLPIEGRKEGVYVKVGSRNAFSPCLAAAASPQSRFLCRLGQQPLASCYDTFAPRFAIRWCNLTLLEVLPTPTTLGPLWGPGVLEDGGDFQPPTESPAQDLLPGFLLTLLVPLAVAALLCLLLGHLMCCRREGVQKRDLETSDIQLVHHSTIHGDTEELRSMASSRDVPRPLSTLPMFNVRTGQRINPMAGRGDGARAPLIPQQR